MIVSVPWSDGVILGAMAKLAKLRACAVRFDVNKLRV
jgi:hypothetical protein